MSEVKKTDGMSTARILNLLGERWSDTERKYVIDRYRNSDIQELTANRHKIVTGRALQIASMVIRRGGTDDEIDKCLEYLMVCIDSKKHKLDTIDCFDDLKIAKIIEKYGRHK